MVQDLATQWLHSQPKFIFTDNSLEFGKAFKNCKWRASLSAKCSRPFDRRDFIRSHFGSRQGLVSCVCFYSFLGCSGEDGLRSTSQMVCCRFSITSFSVNIANLETITIMQSWYKIWPLNGYNLIRVNKNLSGDGKEFTKVSRAVRKTKSHFFMQFFGIGLIL